MKDQDIYEATSTFISCGTSHFVVRTCANPYVARRQNQLMFGMGLLSTLGENMANVNCPIRCE